MKKILQWIKCKLCRHELKVIKHLSDWSDQLQCVHCKRLFAYNYDARFVVPWEEVKDFYLRKESFDHRFNINQGESDDSKPIDPGARQD